MGAIIECLFCLYGYALVDAGNSLGNGGQDFPRNGVTAGGRFRGGDGFFALFAEDDNFVASLNFGNCGHVEHRLVHRYIA